ncbi:MAG: 3-oxoacyl-ACP reductase FabG [Oscillospiraceae bacterium]|jgi:3-oxoacyl-[acyl-carrier protein] reductase|nr:3-oxoacyl-ACP reductase FabG [Oscillospiraceae bacterium]
MTNTAVITGASRGIGRETAKELASEGFKILINYKKNRDLAEELAEEIISNGGEALPIQADISIPEEAEYLIENAEKFGEIDVLVNNAGICLQKVFQDVTKEEWQKLFDTNVGGAINCCASAVKRMIPRKHGKIINISSIWGICGASTEVHYSASKAAIIGLTKALAKELGPSGIRVNCVAPGIINTDMNKNISDEIFNELTEQTPLKRIGTASDVAKIIRFLASSPSNFITGQIISPNGGFLI